jgi:hypothetical protein
MSYYVSSYKYINDINIATAVIVSVSLLSIKLLLKKGIFVLIVYVTTYYMLQILCN